MTDNNENYDYEPDLITLVDEEGQEHEFEIIDNVEIEDERYFALVPTSLDPEETLQTDGELVILKVQEEDGEEFLAAIEDEAEFNSVADIFMERLSDIYDIEQ